MGFSGGGRCGRGEGGHDDVDAACRHWVRALGTAGWLRHCVPAGYGGAHDPLRSLYLVIARETLARHSGLADFAFTMQGLGSAPITLAGSAELKNAYLPRVAKGEAIAAFALTEPDAGSDVAAMSLSARQMPATIMYWMARRLSFRTAASPISTWSSPAPAKPQARAGISAFVVDAGTPGFEIAERIDVTAPHPLARLRFQSCRVPLSRLVGTPGEGFKIAMRSLDIFRAGVAAAALGFARRALDEALGRA